MLEPEDAAEAGGIQARALSDSSACELLTLHVPPASHSALAPSPGCSRAGDRLCAGSTRVQKDISWVMVWDAEGAAWLRLLGVTAPQMTALQAPIDSHRQAQMHCLANIYVGRAPLGCRAKLEINALPPASSPSARARGPGVWQEPPWGCTSLVRAEQRIPAVR